jgi:hypothetical protein
VDFANTAVFGCFADNEMRGACELRSLQSLWCGEAELAFSVEKAWRGQGIGTAMMTQAIRTARSLGIDRLYLTCHRHNRSMQCIAGKFTSKITYEDSECFADIAVHCQPMSPLLDAGDGSDRAERAENQAGPRPPRGAAVTKILLRLCRKWDPDFYPTPFSDGTHFRADGTLLSAAGSWGGIPMSKIRQLRSSGGRILTPY